MGLICFAAGLSSCSDAWEQSGPSDELLTGQLCAPATDGCPSAALLRRSSSLGANRLDFTLENKGQAADITVEAIEAGTTAGPDAADASDVAGGADAGSSDAGSSDAGSSDAGGAGGDPSVLVARSFRLGAGESASSRFVRTELFTRSTFRLQLRCAGCNARLEYALASEPLECRADDDCSSGWLCSQDDGRCVECKSSGDCADGQSCDAIGRCSPERSSGCAHAPGGGSSTMSGVLGLLLLLGLVLIRRRRRLLAPLAAAVCISVVFVAPAAHAEPPRAGINLGLGTRVLTGEMGQHTRRGIGLALSQELRGEYFGGRVELGANYFLTDQPAPPLSRELQIYTVGVGPQFYVPLEPVQIVVGLDYRRVGLVSNSLIRITGPEINHSGAGATLEARYRLAPLEVMLRGGFHRFFGLGSSMITVDVAVGLANE